MGLIHWLARSSGSAIIGTWYYIYKSTDEAQAQKQADEQDKQNNQDLETAAQKHDASDPARAARIRSHKCPSYTLPTAGVYRGISFARGCAGMDVNH